MSKPTLQDWFTQLYANQSRISTLLANADQDGINGKQEAASQQIGEAIQLVQANSEICERINGVYQQIHEISK